MGLIHFMKARVCLASEFYLAKDKFRKIVGLFGRKRLNFRIPTNILLLFFKQEKNA